MKKILSGAFLTIIISTMCIYADDTADIVRGNENTKNACTDAISVNVLPWAFGLWNMAFEHIAVDNFSFRVRMYNAIKGPGLGLNLFYHPMGKALRGWYIGPHCDLWFVSDSWDGSAVLQVPGFMAGYRWILNDQLEMAIGLGIQYIFGNQQLINDVGYEWHNLNSVFDTEIGVPF